MLSPLKYLSHKISVSAPRGRGALLAHSEKKQARNRAGSLDLAGHFGGLAVGARTGAGGALCGGVLPVSAPWVRHGRATKEKMVGRQGFEPWTKGL